MNIFNKVALESLKKNRTRTIVTIIGVVLSVAMIAAVTTFIVSFQTYLVNGEIAQTGDWQVKFTNVDSSFAKKVSADSEVKTAATIQNIGYALLPDSQNLSKPYLFVAGFDDKAMEMMPIHLMEGRLPQTGKEIIVSEHIGSNGGVAYKVGSSVTLALGRRTQMGGDIGQDVSFQNGETEESRETFTPETETTYTIVGICERPGFESFSAPGYTAITKADLAPGSAGSLDVMVAMKSPGKVYDFAERTAGSAGYAYNRALLSYYGVSMNDSFNAELYGLAGILIAIIMIGGILLIYNAFAISVSERSRQFGVLSSVGATKKQLRTSVLFEGACIGVVGIPIGILVGVGGIAITLHFIGNLFPSMMTISSTDVRLSVAISFPALVIAAVMGALTILISAYIPAGRAMKKSAIETIRQTDDVKIKAKEVKTSKLVNRIFGLEGTLAMKNFKRNKRRYRNTVFSLFVCIVLFISASAFGMYLSASVGMTVEDEGYDISVGRNQGTWTLPDEQFFRLFDRMKTADGVYGSAYQNSLTCYASIEKNDFASRFLQYYGEDNSRPGRIAYTFDIHFVDDDTYLSYLETLGLSPNDYGIAQGKLPAVAKVEGYDNDAKRTVSMDVFNESAHTFDIGAGYEPGLYDMPTQKITVAISDILPQGYAGVRFSGLALFAPYSDLSLLGVPGDALSSMVMTFRSHDPFQSATQMETMLKEAGVTSGYTLYNRAEVNARNQNILTAINVFSYGFVILISLITIANVFNTISTGIHLRRREFAMLRSVGMGDRSFSRMMNFECLFYGLKSLLYGLPVAAGITFIIYKEVLRGVDVAFSLPWSSIAISIFGVFLVVFVTMIYATRKMKKANVIDALRSVI